MASLFVDLSSFPCPSLITGGSLTPDLVLAFNSTTLCLLEVTVGFETNIRINIDFIAAKYHSFFTSLRAKYTNINFLHLSLNTCGIFGASSGFILSFLPLLYIV